MHGTKSAVCAVLTAGFVAWAGSASAQTGRARGLVRDETGEPIKGATVRADNPDGAPRSFTASTDDRGRFVMIGLRSGEWMFTAEAPGFDSQAVRVRVRLQGSPPLLFSLPRSVGGPVAALGGLSPRDLQSALADADQLFNAQRWDDALAAYRRILARTPALSVINLQIGAIYREQQKYDEAIATYQALLDETPDNGKALAGMAMTHLDRGELDAAEAPLLEVANASPKPNRDVLSALGDVRAARGDTAGAATWYERAASADPFWGAPLYKLGRLAMDRGDPDTAVAMMQKVIETDPRSPEAAQAQAALAALQH